MIERYTRPEMARVWSDEYKLDTWLRVELLAQKRASLHQLHRQGSVEHVGRCKAEM